MMENTGDLGDEGLWTLQIWESEALWKQERTRRLNAQLVGNLAETACEASEGEDSPMCWNVNQEMAYTVLYWK